MRNITTEEFRTFDQIARTLLNDHIEEGDLDSLDNMVSLIDNMQDSMESATIEAIPTSPVSGPPHVFNPHRDYWVRRSEENFEIVEARVFQLLLLSVQEGGWDKVDGRGQVTTSSWR